MMWFGTADSSGWLQELGKQHTKLRSSLQKSELEAGGTAEHLEVIILTHPLFPKAYFQSTGCVLHMHCNLYLLMGVNHRQYKFDLSYVNSRVALHRNCVISLGHA